MFRLTGSSFPDTPGDLVGAVAGGLAEVLTFPAGKSPVKAEGDSLAGLRSVTVDLTDAVARMDRLPPEPKGVGNLQPGATVARLEVSGRPVRIESAAVELSLIASDARFDYDRDKAGKPLLLLAAAKEGTVSAEIRKRDLEALLLAAAQAAAAKQGAQVLETRLQLTQPDPRTLAVEARVKAKKMFMTATVTIRGKAAIDDALNAHLSNLTCTGEGMMGSMAASMLQSHLDKLNNQVFPLSAVALGDVRLRDLNVTTGETIRITAAFGSE